MLMDSEEVEGFGLRRTYSENSQITFRNVLKIILKYADLFHFYKLYIQVHLKKYQKQLKKLRNN